MQTDPKPVSNTPIQKPVLFKHGANEEEKDLALWQGFKSGDKLAFNFIFESNIKMLYGYGATIAKDREVVADCIQELFIDLWNKRSTLGDTSCIKFYLFKSLKRRIVRRLETDQRRNDNALNAQLSDAFDPSFEAALIHHETYSEKRRYLAHALSFITRRQREAVLLRYYKKLSFEEMALQMNMDIPSVRNVLSKAIQNMRLQLGGEINKIL